MGLPGSSVFGQNHTAKLAVEGGAQLPGVPLLIPLRPDMLVGQCVIQNVFGNGTVVYSVPWVRDELAVPDGCRVTIRLAGYRTVDATLTEGSTFVLKRVGDREGSTISLTSLRAPNEAKKAYQRGLAASNRLKYDEAVNALREAVAAYPAYAQAWSDLGQAQLALERPSDARASWEAAVKSDPKYLKPYAQLARLAVAEGRDQDALAITTPALELSPAEFPQIYFYNAVANFNLKHYDAAEKSALLAIACDSTRELPVAETLLGSILALRGEVRAAVDHFYMYLTLSPKASDADEIRARIDDLERQANQPK